MWEFSVEHLRQSVPPLAPSTVFRTFDYVTTPYADALDAIVSVLILWTTAAIISRLIPLPFGRNTRSLAVRDAYDRLMNMKIPCNCSSHVHTCASSHMFSNFQLRVVALVLFIATISLELLTIFTQSTQWKTRSLDDLNLRSLTLAVPDQPIDSFRQMFQGCQPLLSFHPSSSSNVLSLCAKIFDDQPFVAADNVVEFHCVSTDKFFDAYASKAGRMTILIRYSIVVNDPLRSTLFYANMSRLGFTLTSSKLRWMLETFDARCPSCNATAYLTNTNTSVIRSELNQTENDYPADILLHQLVYTMIQKSTSQLRIADFFSENATDHKQKRELHEFSKGKVKRVSGLILWLVAAVLGIINWCMHVFVWDMDRDDNNMVKAVLDIAPETSLVDSPSIPFSVVEEEALLLQKDERTCREQDLEQGDRTVAHTRRLRLRRRDANGEGDH